ncbi:MAG: transposase [Planctomycetaceae bacterium]|nr:transposase [Planctomycetaceae bacterium]
MTKRRKYTDEFKRGTVKLVTEQGCTTAEAAQSLRIHPGLLGRWRQKFDPPSQRTETMNETEREELIRLREENRRFRMERGI